MEISTLFEIIEKYGWWSIAIAAGLGTVYILVKIISNKLSDGVKGGMEEMSDKLTTSITKQLDTMSTTNAEQIEILSSNIAKQNNELIKAISNQNEKLLSFIINNKKADDEIHDKRVEQRMDVTESIINKLKDIMHTAHAQRAFIIEFHNSFRNLAGSPFAKYTCTFEWFDKGLDEIGSRCVAMPYSTMAKIVGDARRSGNHQILYNDIPKMESENPQLFSLFKDPRTSAVCYRLLYDENNKMMGMIVLEWQNHFDIEVWNHTDMVTYLRDECNHLSTWLDLTGGVHEGEDIE